MHEEDAPICYCGNPECLNFWHCAVTARRLSMADGNGDPIVGLGHLAVIGIAMWVFSKDPMPLWMTLPALGAFCLRWQLLSWRIRKEQQP